MSNYLTQLSKMGFELRRVLIKNQPKIMTGAGVGMGLYGTYRAIKATPKALILIQEAEEQKGEPLSTTEKVKVAWRPYIPAIVSEAGSLIFILGAQSINDRRNAALFTAYSLTEQALSDYKEKVIETVGPKKEKTIMDKVAEDKVTKNPPRTNEVIITGNGNFLCLNSLTGGYFRSDIEKIRHAINNINYRMLNENYISENEVFYELDYPYVSNGDDLGWNIFEDGKIEVQFSTQLTKDGEPCLVLLFNKPPRYDYQKLG